MLNEAMAEAGLQPVWGTITNRQMKSPSAFHKIYVPQIHAGQCSNSKGFSDTLVITNESVENVLYFFYLIFKDRWCDRGIYYIYRYIYQNTPVHIDLFFFPHTKSGSYLAQSIAKGLTLTWCKIRSSSGKSSSQNSQGSMISEDV